MSIEQTPLLAVRNLHVFFDNNSLVSGLDFSVSRGQILAIVGESGSGKSMTALALMELLLRPGRVEADKVTVEGSSLLGLEGEELRQLRGNRMAMNLGNATQRGKADQRHVACSRTA